MVGIHSHVQILALNSFTFIITGDGPLIPVSQYFASLSVLEECVFLAIYVCSTSYLWILRINTLMEYVSMIVGST